jgi:hypothetical protein
MNKLISLSSESKFEVIDDVLSKIESKYGNSSYSLLDKS